MKGPDLRNGVEEDTEVDDIDLNVSVKCPFCPRTFAGLRSKAEDDLYMHLWKVHDDQAVEYMISNMYIPEELKEKIFTEMGDDYVSWLVDHGEIDDGK